MPLMPTTIYHLLVYSFEKLFAWGNFLCFDWCWQDFCDSGFRIFVNTLCLVSTKRPRILKQTCTFQLQICLSMCDLLVDTRH